MTERSWRLYEKGYSPGGGYITETIPANPPQTLRFTDHQIESNINGFDVFKFYKILHDTVTNTAFITFYKKNPDNSVQPDTESYSFSTNEDTLTLNYRWCVEGCHLAFKSIR